MPDNEPGTGEGMDLGASARENVWASADEQPKPDATGTTTTQPSVDDLRAQLRKELEDEIVDVLANEKQDSGIYKGLQKHLAKRDRALAETGQKLSQREQELAALQRQQNEAAEALEFLSTIAMKNLDDDQRAEVVAQLQERRAKRLEGQVAELTRHVNTPREPIPQPELENSFEEQLQARIREAVNEMRVSAKELGVDPDDPGLDYGKDDEAPWVRFRKLNQSVQKVLLKKDEAEVESVKQRGQQEPTRDAGIAASGAPPSAGGQSLLARGAQKRLEMMRRQSA